MEKLKEIFKKNSKTITVAGAVLVCIIATGVGITLYASGNNKRTLEKLLTDMAKDFYENYYYDQTGKTEEERTEFLSKYSKIGIKINLENLALYDNNKNKKTIESEFVNSKTNEPCSEKTTKAVIYPKGNFKKANYDIEVILDCGFESEEKENK